MNDVQQSLAALGFTPPKPKPSFDEVQQKCYKVLGIRTKCPNAAQIRIAHAVARHNLDLLACEKLKHRVEHAYMMLTRHAEQAFGKRTQVKVAAQKPPRVRQRFLMALASATNDPDIWTLMPGTTDHSIWKMVLRGKMCEEIKFDAEKTHALLCRNATNSETSNRQLHYWGFKNLNKKLVHRAKIEIRPGYYVLAEYAEFTHVPKAGDEAGLWSNARGNPSPAHYRLTRFDRVPRKRQSTKRKHAVAFDALELASSVEREEDCLQSLTATYDAKLDEQEECMDLILHTLGLDVSWCDYSAEMESDCEEWFRDAETGLI